MKKNIKLYSFLPIFMVLIYFSNLFILYEGIMSGGKPLDFRFALWVLAMIPVFWIFTFPVYVVVYFIVTKILFNYYKIKLKTKDYLKVLIKSIALGFAFDILISIIMFFVSYFMADTPFRFINVELESCLNDISVAILANPFWNIMAILIMCVMIFIVKYINYKVYFKYLALWLDIYEEKAKDLALYIILLTAPYFYFIPTRLFL